MNKKLLAVAVAGALAAPGVALAQASNVQIYGVFDMSAQMNKFSGPNTTTALQAAQGSLDVSKSNVYNGASRWGIRGTEDLGNGLRAFFQAEAGMFPDARPDSGSSSSGVGFLGGRNSGIGLQASWGQVMTGIWDSPYKSVMDAGTASASGALTTFGMIMGNGDTTGTAPSAACAAVNSVGTGVAAGVASSTNSNATACGDGVEGAATSFHRRLSKTVQYWSPVWNGMQFKIATQLNNYKASTGSLTALNSTNTANIDPSLWSYSLSWTGGPFTAYGAYETHKGYNSTTVSADAGVKDTGMQLGGKWDFGPGAVTLQWERLKYGNNAGVAAATNNFNLVNWALGGTFKIGGNGTLWGSYSKTPGRSSCGSANVVAGTLEGLCGSGSAASFLALGYDHAMSKRTALYATYGKITNGQATTVAGATVGSAYYYIAGPAGNSNVGSVSAIAAGTDVTTYAVGVKHTF